MANLPAQSPVEVSILEVLEQVLLELRGMRLAVVHMATQDKSAVPDDFDMSSPANSSEFSDDIT